MSKTAVSANHAKRLRELQDVIIDCRVKDLKFVCGTGKLSSDEYDAIVIAFIEAYLDQSRCS